MLYITEDIPSNFLTSVNKPNESLYIELNLQNVKTIPVTLKKLKNAIILQNQIGF